MTRDRAPENELLSAYLDGELSAASAPRSSNGWPKVQRPGNCSINCAR